MNSVIVMMTFNIVYTAVVCWLVAVGNNLVSNRHVSYV